MHPHTPASRQHHTEPPRSSQPARPTTGTRHRHQRTPVAYRQPCLSNRTPQRPAHTRPNPLMGATRHTAHTGRTHHHRRRHRHNPRRRQRATEQRAGTTITHHTSTTASRPAAAADFSAGNHHRNHPPIRQPERTIPRETGVHHSHTTHSMRINVHAGNTRAARTDPARATPARMQSRSQPPDLQLRNAIHHRPRMAHSTSRHRIRRRPPPHRPQTMAQRPRQTQPAATARVAHLHHRRRHHQHRGRPGTLRAQCGASAQPTRCRDSIPPDRAAAVSGRRGGGVRGGGE